MMTTNMTRAAVGGVVGFVAASTFLVSPVMDDTAQAKGCTQTYSKYMPGGKGCVPQTSNKVKKNAATILFGCMFGSVGGTPASILYGCGGGVVSVLIDATWGGK